MLGNQSQPRTVNTNVRQLWSWIGGVMVIIAICLAARFLIGPTAAQAQADRATSKNNNNPRTQARPAGTTKTATNNPKSQGANNTNAPTATGGNANAKKPSAAGPNANANAKPNVVAIVDGQSISREDLGRECLRRYGKDVIESVINKQLIGMECQRRGINITDKDIDEEIARMATKFSLSPDRYLMMLEQERNINVQQYRTEVVWRMLALKKLAADQIQVTDEDLKEAFESEYGPKVKARVIVVGSRQKAEDLLKRARANPDNFGDLAKNHSDDVNSASARGLVPPIRKHAGNEEIEKIAFALKPGEISDIVAVGEKFLILKCEAQYPESFVSNQDMPIVEQRLRDSIADHKLRTASAELFQRLQEETKIVNVMNDDELSRKMPGVAATINGRPISLESVADECIQWYGDEVLEGEVSRVILQNALKAKHIQVTKDDLDEEIRRAADAYGFLKSDGVTPDVKRWLDHVTEEAGENTTVDLYVRDAVWPSVALKKLVNNNIEITEEEMQMGFDSNYGERVEVLAIVCPNERLAQKVWDMARQNPSDEYFGQLAGQYSIEPVSRANAGRVPPIRRHGGSDALENAAFKLQTGETSGIVIVGEKHIILRCLGRTEPNVTLNDVRDELTKSLHESKLRTVMATEFEKLTSKAKVQTFLPDSVKHKGSESKETSLPAPAN